MRTVTKTLFGGERSGESGGHELPPAHARRHEVASAALDLAEVMRTIVDPYLDQHLADAASGDIRIESSAETRARINRVAINEQAGRILAANMDPEFTAAASGGQLSDMPAETVASSYNEGASPAVQSPEAIVSVPPSAELRNFAATQGQPATIEQPAQPAVPAAEPTEAEIQQRAVSDALRAVDAAHAGHQQGA